MRTHTLQNGNQFRADAFAPQEGDQGSDAASGAGDSDDTITLTNGNVFKSSAFLPQEEEEKPKSTRGARAAKAPVTRRKPTWDLEATPEEYLKREGVGASLSALALATLGLTREEYEELQEPTAPPPAPASTQTPAPVVAQSGDGAGE